MQESHIAWLESLRIGLVLDEELVRRFPAFGPDGVRRRLAAAADHTPEAVPADLIAAAEAAGADRGALAEVLRKHTGCEEIPLLALRAFLAHCHVEFKYLPGFKKSDLVPHVNVYMIAFEASKLMDQPTREAEFLELWHSHEMLDYHADPDLLIYDKGRAADILSTFSYFLWLFWVLEPTKISQWDELNEKIGERWSWLEKEGKKRGKKYDNPLHLWRLETGQQEPEKKKKNWSGKHWGEGRSGGKFGGKGKNFGQKRGGRKPRGGKK